MYTVKTRIFGKYVDEGCAATMDEAIEVAKEINSRGWLYVRIIHPNGMATQMFWQDDNDPLDDLRCSILEEVGVLTKQ